LNELVTEGSAAFGAPVLSASSDGVVQVEDPTYNPAAAASIEATPIVVVTEPEKTNTITITDDGL